MKDLSAHWGVPAATWKHFEAPAKKSVIIDGIQETTKQLKERMVSDWCNDSRCMNIKKYCTIIQTDSGSTVQYCSAFSYLFMKGRTQFFKLIRKDILFREKWR